MFKIKEPYEMTPFEPSQAIQGCIDLLKDEDLSSVLSSVEDVSEHIIFLKIAVLVFTDYDPKEVNEKKS